MFPNLSCQYAMMSLAYDAMTPCSAPCSGLKDVNEPVVREKSPMASRASVIMTTYGFDPANRFWNRLHPEEPVRPTYVEKCLGSRAGPVIAATDYMKLYADQIRAFVPKRYTVLGTDGFGRSDTRRKLRSFFEVDRYYVAVSALSSLAAEGAISPETVTLAMAKYGIDPEKADPVAL